MLKLITRKMEQVKRAETLGPILITWRGEGVSKTPLPRQHDPMVAGCRVWTPATRVLTREWANERLRVRRHSARSNLCGYPSSESGRRQVSEGGTYQFNLTSRVRP